MILQFLMNGEKKHTPAKIKILAVITHTEGKTHSQQSFHGKDVVVCVVLIVCVIVVHKPITGTHRE